MTAPAKELERLVVAKELDHGGNPVMAWAASNTMADIDPAGNIKPSKKKSTKRIDPIVATVNAIAVALVAGKPVVSRYETEGLFTF
jgi:phage terminase large subunit-like protein